MAIVLRLFEVEGQETTARVRLSPAFVSPGAAAVEVDTLELEIEEGTARLEGDVLSVRVPAFGISTVRIE
jgi:hypothetical protein